MMIPILYLLLFVWETRLSQEPSVTRLIFVGTLLVVLMIFRPQGLLGERREGYSPVQRDLLQTLALRMALRVTELMYNPPPAPEGSHDGVGQPRVHVAGIDCQRAGRERQGEGEQGQQGEPKVGGRRDH